jgi:hypothetical protein
MDEKKREFAISFCDALQLNNQVKNERKENFFW